MNLTIVTIILSIITTIICILTFSLNRKDKSNNDIGNSQYKMGALEEKVDNISRQLDKVLEKLDGYDNEIDKKIEKAICEHVNIYHNNKGNK